MRLLAPFCDDSSLIFAVALRTLCARRGWDVELLHMAPPPWQAALSPRQMEAHGVPPSPPLPDSALAPRLERGCDAVVASRVPEVLCAPLERPDFLARRDRPCFIAFHTGLEFDPSRGFWNRQLFDTVFLAAHGHRDLIGRRWLARARCRDLRVGHPYFLRPGPGAAPRGDAITFFAQAISPATRRARAYMLSVLVALAEAHPHREVVLKLRQLPTEQTAHLERDSYPALVAELDGPLPPNLCLSAASATEALARAGLCLTCTSTAAMDAISAGIPTLVHTRYPDHWDDPLAAAMEREFAGSGLLATLERVLALDAGHPHPGWLAERFVAADELLDDIAAAVTRLRG